MQLRKNIGRADRVVRLVLGALFVSAGLLHLGMLTDAYAANAIAVIGAVALLTAAIGYCPLYQMAGINNRVNVYNLFGKSP